MSLVALALISSSESRSADTPPADTVFVNGRAMLFPGLDGTQATVMDPTVGWASAVGVTGDKISYVGDDQGAQAQIGPDTEVVDLHGKMLMPGVGDGHLHEARPPMCEMDYEGGTVETVLGKLKDCLMRDDQVGYLNSNYKLTAGDFMGEGMLPSGTRLDRHILDRLSKDPSEDAFGTGTTRPIIVNNMDAHKWYTNTQAITNAGFDASTPDPTNGGFMGRDEDGFPNGQFVDFSGNWGPNAPAGPQPTAVQKKVADIKHFNSLGITNVMHALGGASNLSTLKTIADNGDLTVRFSQAMSASWVNGSETPATIASRINTLNGQRAQYDGYTNPASPGQIKVNTVKIFCDGVAEWPGQTAAMLRPYRQNLGTAENPIWVNTDNYGQDPSCAADQNAFLALDAAHWNIHTHSLGDRAVRDSLDNYELINNENESWDRRDQIAHDEFVDAADIPRFAQLGVVASMTGQWEQRDAWSVDGITGYVAPGRMNNLYPAQDIVNDGGVVAQGSDWPITRLVPWSAIEQFVTREGEDAPERGIYPGQLNEKPGMTIAQAYRASTIAVAYQLHLDDVTGSIDDGKFADLVAVDHDPFFVPGVTDQLAEKKAALPGAEQDLADAEDALDAADAAIAPAQSDLAAKRTALTQAEQAQKSAQASQQQAAKRARTARKALQKAKRKPASKAKRRAVKAKARALKARQRTLGQARGRNTKAQGSVRGADAAVKAAEQTLSQRQADVTTAQGAVDEAKGTVDSTKSDIASLETQEAAGQQTQIKQVSDTKALMTMVGGKVVYTDPEDTLGMSGE
ncbi:MAG: amidohydrolase family protein [Solirubrobacterales bacterium]|nr:amidohydrolase family protein [Solirubrobacterales bacterium]